MAQRGSEPGPLAEDIVETSVTSVTKCFATLLSTGEEEMSDEETSRTPSKKRRKPANPSLPAAQVDKSFVNMTSFPHLFLLQIDQLRSTLSQYLSSLRNGLLCQLASGPDRIYGLLTEMVFTILKSDSLIIAEGTHSSSDESIPCAIAILCDVFSASKAHRGYIIQDLVSLTCQNQSKLSFTRLFGKNLRSQSQCNLTLSPSSAVMIALVQSQVKLEAGLETDLTSLSKLTLADANAMASILVSEMSKRCHNKDTGADYRSSLNNLIGDLLNAQSFIHLPAASLILTAFVRKSTSDISEGTTSHSTEYTMFLVDVLGGIGAKLLELSGRFCPGNEITLDETLITHLRNSWTQKKPKSKKLQVAEALDVYCLLANIVLEEECEKINQTDKRLPSRVLNFDDVDDDAVREKLCDPTIVQKFLNFELPAFNHLVNACGIPYEKQSKLLPEMNPSDLHHYCLINFLLSELKIQSCGRVDPSTLLFQSIISNVALWMMNSLKIGNVHVASFASKIIHKLHQFSKEGNCDLKQLTLPLLFDSHRSSQPAISVMSPEWASHCCLQILVKQRFLRNDILAVQKSLLNLFSHPSPLVRSRVVRSLHLLVKADPSLFQNRAIQESVVERFNDVAISVREEVVKLVGGYLLEPRDNISPMEIRDGYLSALMIRLRDKGVSVRKSVVQILRVILLHQPHHPKYSEICLRLLERTMNPKEEDTVKDVIQQTFQQVWFNPAPTEAVEATGSWSVLSTPQRLRKQESSTIGSISPIKSTFDTRDHKHNTPSRSSSKSISTAHAEVTALQIVDVVYFSLSNGNTSLVSLTNQSSLDWLIRLIREVLHGENTALEVTAQARKRRSSSLDHCERLVDALLNMLLSCEFALKDTPTSQGNRTPQETIVALFVTFSCICKAHPPYVVRHIHTLLPYLKGENGLSLQQDSVLCSHLIQIISTALTLSVPPVPSEQINLCSIFQEEHLSSVGSLLPITPVSVWESRSDEIASDLTRIALNYPITTIQPAIECLAQLATHVSRSGDHLLSLAKKCFDSISDIARSMDIHEVFGPGINRFEVSASQFARIQRSIIVLGYICEQTNKCMFLRVTTPTAPNDEIISRKWLHQTTSSLGSLCESALNGSCYVCVKFCLSLSSEVIQTRAAQALCSVFVGQPNLILAAEKDGILDWLLGTSQRTPLLVISRTLQSLNKVIKEEDNLSLGLGDLHSPDGTVTGNILRRHISSLTVLMTTSPEQAVRLNALELIGTLLTHGMVHPMDVFTVLIGMQGDDDETIRQLSLSILIEQDERCSNFLDNRILEGVECAFQLQKQRHGKSFPFLLQTSDSDIPILCTTEGTIIHGMKTSSQRKSWTSLISSLYSACFRNTKKRRMDLIIGLLRRCEFHCQSIATVRERVVSEEGFDSRIEKLLSAGSRSNGTTPLPMGPKLSVVKEMISNSFQLISFLGALLSSLPFCWADEPLSAIYWISRNSNVTASIFEKLFRSSLKEICATEYVEPDRHSKKAQAEICEEIDSSIQCDKEDLLVLKLPPTPSTIEDSNVDILLSILSIESRSRIILMRLKSYFKSVFSFSDERCLSFTPSYDKEASELSAQRSAQLALSEKDREVHRGSIFRSLPSYLECDHDGPSVAKQQEQQLKNFIKIYNCHYSLVHGDGNDLTIVQKKSSAKKEGKVQVRKQSKSKKKPAVAPTPPRIGASRKRKAPNRYGNESEEECHDDDDSDYDERES
jgi:hypothetical protein